MNVSGEARNTIDTSATPMVHAMFGLSYEGKGVLHCPVLCGPRQEVVPDMAARCIYAYYPPSRLANHTLEVTPYTGE